MGTQVWLKKTCNSQESRSLLIPCLQRRKKGKKKKEKKSDDVALNNIICFHLHFTSPTLKNNTKNVKSRSKVQSPLLRFIHTRRVTYNCLIESKDLCLFWWCRKRWGSYSQPMITVQLKRTQLVPGTSLQGRGEGHR